MAKNEIPSWEKAIKIYQHVGHVEYKKMLTTDMYYNDDDYARLLIRLTPSYETNEIEYISLLASHVYRLIDNVKELDEFEIPYTRFDLPLDYLSCPYKILSVEQLNADKNNLYVLVESVAGHQLYLDIKVSQRWCVISSTQHVQIKFETFAACKKGLHCGKKARSGTNL
jgi:hypothetical protein